MRQHGSRRRFLQLAAGAAALPTVSGSAWAQGYPSRPISLMVPFPPGGLTDVVGRILAEGMRASLGQSVIIENVGGATGSIGTGRVARAAPDGYTLTVGIWNTHVANGIMYPLQYDVVNDFEPIVLLADAPLVILAKKDLPANNVRELIAWLKANPGKSRWAQPAPAVPAICLAICCNSKQIPNSSWSLSRRQSGMQDVVAGQIELMIANPATSLPHVRAGRAKAFAVTANHRMTIAPEIPSVGRGRAGRLVVFTVGSAVCSARHAEGDHRQAQRCGGEHDRRSRVPAETHGPGTGNSAAPAADPASPCGLPEGRNRKMVADHQGGGHQAGVSAQSFGHSNCCKLKTCASGGCGG